MNLEKARRMDMTTLETEPHLIHLIDPIGRLQFPNQRPSENGPVQAHGQGCTLQDFGF